MKKKKKKKKQYMMITEIGPTTRETILKCLTDRNHCDKTFFAVVTFEVCAVDCEVVPMFGLPLMRN